MVTASPEGIGGGGEHHLRADAVPQLPVKSAHPQLHADGQDEDEQGDGLKIQRFRVQDLADGFLKEREAHLNDQKSHNQGGDVFDPPVSEGMFLIGGFFRELDADQTDDRRAGIGEIVEGVGCDGDAVQGGPDDKFCGKKKSIAQNTHKAGEHTVGCPHGKAVRLLIIFYKMLYQKISHRNLLCTKRSYLYLRLYSISLRMCRGNLGFNACAGYFCGTVLHRQSS